MMTVRKKVTTLFLVVLAGSLLVAMDAPAVLGQKPAPPGAAILKVTATVNPNPPRVGENALDVSIADGSGQPVPGLKLTTRVEMASMDMGTAHPAVHDAGGGRYHTAVNFGMAGPWRVILQAGSSKAALQFDAGGKEVWKSPVVSLVSANSSAATPGITGMAMATPAKAIPSDNTSGSAMAGMDKSNMDMKPLKMPQLQEQGSYVATGHENWKVRTGFGKNAGMVGMMSQMMVGGSGMEGMKMPPMKMEFGKQNYTEDQDDAGAAGSSTMPRNGGAMPGMPMGDSEPGAGAAPAQTITPVSAPNGRGTKAPAHASAASATPGMKMTAAPLAIEATISSPKSGDNTLTVTVRNAAGSPVVGARIAGTVVMTSMDMGTTHPSIKEVGSGRYRGTVSFSMSGPWRVTVKVTPPGGGPPQKASFDFNAR